MEFQGDLFINVVEVVVSYIEDRAFAGVCLSPLPGRVQLALQSSQCLGWDLRRSTLRAEDAAALSFVKEMNVGYSSSSLYRRRNAEAMQ